MHFNLQIMPKRGDCTLLKLQSDLMYILAQQWFIFYKFFSNPFAAMKANTFIERPLNI